MGLVQKVLEASGISTVILSWIPELTRATGVPRLAGIGYPSGRSLGMPHDANGQRAVLRSTLQLLETAQGPDTFVELPYSWPQSRTQALADQKIPPPPISRLLMKKPWLLPRLYAGKVPEAEV